MILHKHACHNIILFIYLMYKSMIAHATCQNGALLAINNINNFCNY